MQSNMVSFSKPVRYTLMMSHPLRRIPQTITQSPYGTAYRAIPAPYTVRTIRIMDPRQISDVDALLHQRSLNAKALVQLRNYANEHIPPLHSGSSGPSEQPPQHRYWLRRASPPSTSSSNMPGSVTLSVLHAPRQPLTQQRLLTRLASPPPSHGATHLQVATRFPIR